MAAQPEGINGIRREAVYRIRELCSQDRKLAFGAADKGNVSYTRLADMALYPEKPLLSFEEELPKELEILKFAGQFAPGMPVRRLLTCGGVDDGKSTLIGRILYDTMTEGAQEAVRSNPVYLRDDGSVDFALLAAATEEEARQGITVQVSYSTFYDGGSGFLMADVPGHEEYTHHMAYAAAGAETAVIMTAANKGIVAQTRRHTRICYFMGIRTMIFAVNKMDMISYKKQAFDQISEEIAQMMEEYAGCTCQIIPVAAKGGKNITALSAEMPWYTGNTLLGALQQPIASPDTKGVFLMPVQRICKSSQMKGAVVKKRVIQGEAVSGSIRQGEEILVYPALKRARVSTLFCLDQKTDTIQAGDPVGLELDRELDVARGCILAGEDVLNLTDRVEADLLWTLDNRLTQGKRYAVQAGTCTKTAAVTKICYLMDVNTGEHRYAEYVTKNELARCELYFQGQLSVSCEKDNRALGTLRLFDRETGVLAAYANIVHTVSEEALKRDGRDVTSAERESCLGQKAGLILFDRAAVCPETMHYAERYLLRMGFHTIKAAVKEDGKTQLQLLRALLDAGLIVLTAVNQEDKETVRALLKEERVFCCMGHIAPEEINGMLKRLRQWALSLI